jgi:hypothetical protein
MTTIVDHDYHTGITETYHKDAMTGKIHVKQEQDVEGLFSLNAIDRNTAKTGWKEEFHKVASIPLNIINIWREEMKASGYPNPNPLAKEHERWLIAKINSSDFLKLRTKEGVI